MPAEGRGLRLACLTALLLCAPYGEGGASPAALLLTQSLVVAGCLAVLFAPPGDRTPARLPAGLLRGVAVILAIAALSGWSSAYPYASFLRLLDLAVFATILILAGGEAWTRDEKGLLLDALLASAVGQSVLVIAGWAAGTSATFLADFGMLNANHEAAYLLLAGLVTLPRLFQKQRRWAVAARGSAMGILMLAFALLMSRGALLGLAAACAVLLLLRGSWQRRVSQATLAAALGVVLLVSAAGVATRFWRWEDPYRYERVRIWASDVRSFSERPLLGIGPGMYRHVAHRHNFPLEGPVRFGRSFQTPHSDYLGVMVELGLAGIAAAGYVLYEILRRLARKGSRGEELSLGVLAGCAGLAAQGLVEDLTTRPGLMVSLGILVGMSLAERRSFDSGGTARTRTRLQAWAAGGVLALSWHVAVLRPFLAHRSDAAMRRATSYTEMEKHFRAAIWRNPYQAPTYRYPVSLFLSSRPEVPLSLDLYARFRKDLDRGIRMNRVSPDSQVARARLESRAFRETLRDSSTMARAIAAYRSAIRLAPHDPRIRVEMAGFLDRVGRRDEAARQLALALQEEPGFLSARYLLSRLLWERGEQEAARRAYRLAEDSRTNLVTYRPDSAYSEDITRDPEALRLELRRQLGSD